MKNVFASVVGRPNAGKSSIINSMMGEKVSIVSQKPQTTRDKILGVLTKDELQIVFTDTPGIHKPRNKLDNYMNKSILYSISNVDIVILVVDATKKIGIAEHKVIDRLKKESIPALVAINKIDLVKKKENILSIISELSELFKFDSIIPVCAINGEGIDILLKEISSYSKQGLHFFPDDCFTDQSEKVLISELIREKFLLFTDKEIPHGIFVSVEKIEDDKISDILYIDVTVYCEKKSHKGIIIGKNGDMIKKIKSASKKELADFFGCKINLDLWVKVKPDWRNREAILNNFGYNCKNFE